MSDEATPATAGEMNEADALAAFDKLVAAKDASADSETAPAPVVEETPAEVTPAAPAADEVPAITPTPAAPAPAAAATDIWASASPELRAAHAAEIEKADQRYKSDIGRQAAHQRKIAFLEEQLAKAAKPAATPASAEAPVTTSLRDNPAIKKALEDYPETGIGLVVEALEASNAENARVSRVLASIEEDRRNGAILTQEQAFDAAYPNWRQECATKDFADWFNVQPPSVQKIIKENGDQVVNAEDAINQFGNYRAHLALAKPVIPQPAIPATAAPTILADRRAAQLKAVTPAPSGGPTGIPNGAPVGEAEAVFQHFAAKKAQKG